jgi:cullin 1
MNDMANDLARMYRLFGRVSQGLTPVAEILRQHILNLGNENVNQRTTRNEGKDEKELNDDPQFVKVYIA